MYFGHKHVETGPNRPHELTTVLNYHMPLIPLTGIKNEIKPMRLNAVR